MNINKELNNLESTNIYSLMLFAMYKLINIPEYSTLSELVYILNKDDFLNLCEYFGGTTIKIPTIHELKSLTYALLLYQYVNIDNIEYNEALKLIGHDSNELREVKTNYANLCEVLKNYKFDLNGK